MKIRLNNLIPHSFEHYEYDNHSGEYEFEFEITSMIVSYDFDSYTALSIFYDHNSNSKNEYTFEWQTKPYSGKAEIMFVNIDFIEGLLP